MDGNSGVLDAALLAKHRAVCENALQRLTAGFDAEDAAAWDAAYTKIRESNESFIARNSEKFGDSGAAALRGIVEGIIAQNARERCGPAPVDEDHILRLVGGVEPIGSTKGAPLGRRSGLFGGFVGAGLAVLAAAVLWFAEGAWSSTSSEAERQGRFEVQFEKSLPSIEVAVQFLERVEQEVIERQKASDKAAFAARAGKGLVNIDKVLPELAKEMPKELPPRTVLYLVANTAAYKIVFRSVLCTTVEFARPAMVDAKRKHEGLGCEFFGVWNAAGAKL